MLFIKNWSLLSSKVQKNATPAARLGRRRLFIVWRNSMTQKEWFELGLGLMVTMSFVLWFGILG